MPDLLEKIAGFALILLLPLVIIGGALVTLFAVGALFDALDHPGEVREAHRGGLPPAAQAAAHGRTRPLLPAVLVRARVAQPAGLRHHPHAVARPQRDERLRLHAVARRQA